MFIRTSSPYRQQGAVAIIVGLSLAVLIGFAGLALDLGRLYVNKTELQNAADACALAAARELTCSVAPCPATNLTNAQSAGIYVAQRNRSDLQGAAVTIVPEDVRFSTTLAPDSAYKSINGGAPTNAKYVMCIARSDGIVPWFMRVMGLGDANNVTAMAVASLAPAQNNCGFPMAMCSNAPSAPWGLVPGNWYEAWTDKGKGGQESWTGNFNWIDFSPPNGGASELKSLITGEENICNVTKGTPVGENGKVVALGQQYNTRFGIYAGSEKPNEAQPDQTGYAYTSGNWPTARNALGDFLAKRAVYKEFVEAGTGLKVNGTILTSAQLRTVGGDRRLVTIPIVDCDGWNSSQTVPIQDWACVLLLHPMGTGGGKTNDLWIEYEGLSTEIDSPCGTTGVVGGPGSEGPKVPALVR